MFSLPSPFVGGYTKWHILQDEEIEQFEDFSNAPPEVISGLKETEAKAVFDKTPLWMFGRGQKDPKAGFSSSSEQANLKPKKEDIVVLHKIFSPKNCLLEEKLVYT